MLWPREYWAMLSTARQPEDSLRRQMIIEFDDAGAQIYDLMREHGIDKRQLLRTLEERQADPTEKV